MHITQAQDIICIFQRAYEWILWSPSVDFWFKLLIIDSLSLSIDNPQIYIIYLHVYYRSLPTVPASSLVPQKCILHSLRELSKMEICLFKCHVGCFPLFVYYLSLLPYLSSSPAHKYFSWCACYGPETVSIILPCLSQKVVSS